MSSENGLVFYGKVFQENGKWYFESDCGHCDVDFEKEGFDFDCKVTDPHNFYVYVEDNKLKEFGCVPHMNQNTFEQIVKSDRTFPEVS